MTTTILRRTLIACGAAMLAAGPALADDAASFPNKPVTIVVGYPAGGSTDLVGRLVANEIEKHLGQTVVVENLGGAGGAIGAQKVASAKPDGYSILFTLSSLSTLPEQAEVNRQKPAFLLSQLKPVARISTDPLAIVVRADSPLKTLSDLMVRARSRPGEMSYGSSGNYGTVHIPVEIFAHEAGLKLNHIPYAGGAPLMVGLLGGQVDFTMLPRSSIASHVRAGKLRVLATVGAEAWPQFLSAPSTEASGLNVGVLPWTGAFVPFDVSPTVMERLLDEVSFDATRLEGQTVTIDAAYVDERLQMLSQDEDLSRFIL